MTIIERIKSWFGFKPKYVENPNGTITINMYAKEVVKNLQCRIQKMADDEVRKSISKKLKPLITKCSQLPIRKTIVVIDNEPCESMLDDTLTFLAMESIINPQEMQEYLPPQETVPDSPIVIEQSDLAQPQAEVSYETTSYNAPEPSYESPSYDSGSSYDSSSCDSGSSFDSGSGSDF